MDRGAENRGLSLMSTNKTESVIVLNNLQVVDCYEYLRFEKVIFNKIMSWFPNESDLELYVWMPEHNKKTQGLAFVVLDSRIDVNEVTNKFKSTKKFKCDVSQYRDWLLEESRVVAFPKIVKPPQQECTIAFYCSVLEILRPSIHVTDWFPLRFTADPNAKTVSVQSDLFFHRGENFQISGTISGDDFSFISFPQNLESNKQIYYFGSIQPPYSLVGNFKYVADNVVHQQGRFEAKLKLFDSASSLTVLEQLQSFTKSLKSEQPTFGNENNNSSPTGSSDFISEIPQEALVEIFSYLDLTSVCILSSVSRTIKVVAESNWLWHMLYDKKFRGTFFCNKVHPTTIGYTLKNWYKATLLQEGHVHAHKIVAEDIFFLNGFTENNASYGNITRVHKINLELHGGILKADVQYEAGTDYNEASCAKWTGKYFSESGLIFWEEKLTTHQGLFVYSGRIVDHFKIVGRYYWDIKPTATGTFQFTLLK